MIVHNSSQALDIPIRVSDVAKMLQIATHTLRFWEKEFDFYLKPHRTAGFQRRYDTDSIERLRKIHHYLKNEGYSIAGTKRILSSLAA